MQDVNLRFWKSGTVIATAEAQYFHPDSCEKSKWPLVSFTSIYSSLSWSKFKSKDSFEKLRIGRFWNWTYFLNLVKTKLQYQYHTVSKLSWIHVSRIFKPLLAHHRRQENTFYKVFVVPPHDNLCHWSWTGYLPFFVDTSDWTKVCIGSITMKHRHDCHATRR